MRRNGKSIGKEEKVQNVNDHFTSDARAITAESNINAKRLPALAGEL